MKPGPTLFLSQREVIGAGATDVDWVGRVLEQVFPLHEQQAFTVPPSSFLKRPECPRPHYWSLCAYGDAGYCGGSLI
jgi:hypothetical protein